MKQIVRDMGSAQDERGWLSSDFENILKRIENYEGEFIFAVRKTGADLIRLSMGEYLKSMRDFQTDRYYYLNNAKSPYFPIIESNHYFHYKSDDSIMSMIEKDDAVAIYRKFMLDLAAAFQILYPELPIVNRHVDIHFVDFERVMKQIRFAESIGNDTLLDCIRRFHNYARCNDDHEVRICVEDDARHNLYFEVYISGEYSSNGGIIFWPETEKRKAYWSIHT